VVAGDAAVVPVRVPCAAVVVHVEAGVYGGDVVFGGYLLP
jgi:hypothetical protein